MGERQEAEETVMDPQREPVLGSAAGGAAEHVPAPRDSLDREEHLIRDSVLRMGSLVESAIRDASRALVAHDAALALDVIKGDAIINEAASRGSSRRPSPPNSRSPATCGICSRWTT
jgi:hypothetical protein